MTETWPHYEIKVLDEARIIETRTGEVVWEPAAHVAVVRIRTKLDAIVPIPKQLIEQDDPSILRPYVIDELHRKIDAETRTDMTDEDAVEVEPTEDDEVEPTAEPADEPSDPHAPPLDDENDARYLDPVDSRRREAERHRGRSFNDDDEGTDT
jgi:hypothetical protein